MKIFGTEVITEPQSPRYNVWEINKLAVICVLIGIISFFTLCVSSFSFPIYITVFIINSIIFFLIKFYFIGKAERSISDLLIKLNKDELFEYNNPNEVTIDLKKDNAMCVVTAQINLVFEFLFYTSIGLGILFVLLILVYSLPIFILNIFFFNPWLYLGVLMTEKAKDAALNDFDASATSGPERMFNIDTQTLS